MNEKYQQDFLHAGALAKEVRAFGKSLIQKGSSYNEVISKINEKIRSLKARPAFPPQIALNDVAAHFLPLPDQDIIFSDEVVKLDIGVCYNGAIGDCAVTIDLSGKNQKLIDAAEAALLAAEKIVQVGCPIREIGRVIEEQITSFGYKPIRNLCGHGLGFYRIHMPPMIPNYDDRSNGLIIPGMTFAIEPFATSGRGSIAEEGQPTIFSFIAEKPIRDMGVRALLARIKTFSGLPFAIHDLITETAQLSDVKKRLSELLRAGIIAGYAPLVELKGSFVAQAENSILVDKKGKVFVTTR